MTPHSGTPGTLKLRGRWEDAIAQSRKIVSNLKQSNDLPASLKLKNGEMNERMIEEAKN